MTNNTNANNEVTINNNSAEQQMRIMMQSPTFKRALRESEKVMATKKKELIAEKDKLQIIKNSIANTMLGKPEYRQANIIKVVDGCILRVTTDAFSVIQEVKPISKFDELSHAERASIYETDRKSYKLLQENLYTPKVTDKVVDLMISDGLQYEKFDIMASTPSKPNLDGMALGSVESCNLLREYSDKKADLDARLARYEADMKSYSNGDMHNDRFAVEEKIATLERELKGDI